MRLFSFAVPITCMLAGVLVGTLLVPPSVEESAPPPPPSERDVLQTTRPLHESPPDAAPLGSGIIEGRVATRDGELLEGVTVVAYRGPPHERAWPFSAPSRVDALGPPDPDRMLAEEADRIRRGHLYRAASRREVITGRDGAFVIYGLAEEYYRLLAFREGFRIRLAGTRAGARSGEEVSFVAKPIVRLAVEVVGPAGQAPERASLDLSGSFDDSVTWTPERTVIDVVPGFLTIAARVDDDRLRGASIEVEIPSGTPPDPVVLRLELRRGLRGKVEFPAGQSSAFHAVVALELLDGSDPSPERLLTEGVRDHLFGQGAEYSFEDLGPGRYLVGVVRERERVLTSEHVTVTKRAQVRDFLVPGAEVPPKSLLLRVFAPDGRPVPWLRVSTIHRNERGGERSAGRTQRVEPGVYRVMTSAAGSEAKHGEKHLVRVQSTDYGTREVEYDPTAGGEVTVRFEEPAFLTVAMAGYIDSRYEGETRLQVTRPGRAFPPFGSRSSPPEPDGSQTFGPLAPGEYEITLWLGMGMSPARRWPVPLRSGPQKVALDLPPLHTLTIRVEGEDGGRGFYLQRLDSPGFHAAPSPVENGCIRFEHLQAGKYLLSRHAGPREHMPLRITGDRTVSFLPIPFDAILVSITDPAGALAAAGLRTDDLVVAIDGTEITGEIQGYGLRSAAAAKGRATVSVLRGGERLDLDVDLAAARDPARAGGEMTAWHR